MDYERIKLDTACFFWGSLSDGQAAYLLYDTQEGTFVARETQTNTKGERKFSIVVRTQNGIASFLVVRDQGLLSLNFGDTKQPKATTLHGLIKKLMRKTEVDSAVFTLSLTNHGLVEMPVRMARPFKRISSLKAHCRRAWRMKHDAEEIDELPLPNQMKKYLGAMY